MKRKTGKRVISLLLACVMVLTPVASQAKNDLEAVWYVYDEDTGKRTGIEGLIIDGVTYYDLYDGSGDTNLGSSIQFFQDALTKEYEDGSLWDNWTELAYAILASEWEYANLEDERTYLQSGPRSELLTYLSSLDAHSQSTSNKDGYVENSTGLQYTNSLSGVRDHAIDIAYNDANHFVQYMSTAKNVDSTHNVKKSVAQSGFDNNNILSELNDSTETDVFYNIVDFTSYGDGGGKDQYINNNMWGIAFYDFQLQVIANDDLPYITAAEGYDSLQDAASDGAPGVTYTTTGSDNDNLNYYQNRTTSEAEVGMEFTQSTSMSVSNTMESSSSYTYSEMLGTETKLGSSILGLVSLEETFTADFTTEEAVSTAYSDETTATQETSSTTSTSMTLPAQTAVSIESSTGTTTASLEYDCPVAVSYKVCVFSCSPQWSDPNNKEKKSLFEIKNYSSLVTKFGTSNTVGGLNARENLYNRAITYRDMPSYDRTHGQVTGIYRASNSTLNNLNWDNILNGVIQLEDLEANKVPIYIETYEVNTEGGTATEGALIDQYLYKESGYLGHDTEVGAENPYVVTDEDEDGNETSTYYDLYTGPVYDSDGNNVNENLNNDEDDPDYYWQTINPKNDSSNTVSFYYVLSEDQHESESESESETQSDTTQTDQTDADQPQTTSLSAPDIEEYANTELPEETTAEEPEITEETEGAAEPEEIIVTEEGEVPEGTVVEEEPAVSEEPAAAEEPVEEESAAPEEITVAEEPVQPEDTTIAGYAATTETEEIGEAVEPAEPEPVEVYEEPTVSYEDDIIIEDGDLIGSVSNGGTVAGIDSTGSSAGSESNEPTLTIESIEVVESADIPAELQDGEDHKEAEQPQENAEDEASGGEPAVYSAVTPLANINVDVNSDVIWIVNHMPLSISGATLDVIGQSTTSEIYDMVAVYPLNYTSVTSDQKIFEMITGSTLNVDNVIVSGFNKNDVEYYGFNQDKGYWVLADEDGNEIDDSEVASLSTNANTGVTLLTAEKEGTIYLKYMIDENAGYTYMDGEEPATNDDMSSAAMVQIKVANGPFNGTVIASGTLTGYANDDEPINLDTADGLDVEVYDEKDRKVYDAAITWEAQLGEKDGIILEDNRLSFTKAGEYKIRAVYGYSSVNDNPYSDWITVTALPEKKINTLKIEDKTSPATLSDITIGEGKETVNLGWLTTTAKDQYNLDWTKLQNLKWYVDGKEIKANDAGSYLYTATEEDGGTHTIYAMCDGVKSNELTLTVYVPATKVKLSKSSMSLKTGKTKALEATMSPSGTTDTLTWKSSDKKVATVNEKGEVTGVGAGTATITAKATSGKSASCEVTVTMSKGDTFTKGAYTYVVKDASTDGKGKVYMTGFAKGQSKKKVAVPDTVTVSGTTYKVTAIANEAFKGNSKITSFTSGANLTTIGKSAFEGCSKLKTVDIGNSVKKIEFKAFYDCYKLKTLSIGKNVNFMGAHCFCNDYKLQKITIKTTKLKAKNVESPHVFINVNNAKMKVPKSQYKAYTKLFTAREFGGKITK